MRLIQRKCDVLSSLNSFSAVFLWMMLQFWLGPNWGTSSAPTPNLIKMHHYEYYTFNKPSGEGEGVRETIPSWVPLFVTIKHHSSRRPCAQYPLPSFGTPGQSHVTSEGEGVAIVSVRSKEEGTNWRTMVFIMLWCHPDSGAHKKVHLQCVHFWGKQ